ncbi:MAG: hypothetical protein ACOX7B_04680 [Christensenellales bacterium]|jgi:hypothetical protein
MKKRFIIMVSVMCLLLSCVSCAKADSLLSTGFTEEILHDEWLMFSTSTYMSPFAFSNDGNNTLHNSKGDVVFLIVPDGDELFTFTYPSTGESAQLKRYPIARCLEIYSAALEPLKHDSAFIAVLGIDSSPSKPGDDNIWYWYSVDIRKILFATNGKAMIDEIDTPVDYMLRNNTLHCFEDSGEHFSIPLNIFGIDAFSYTIEAMPDLFNVHVFFVRKSALHKLGW